MASGPFFSQSQPDFLPAPTNAEWGERRAPFLSPPSAPQQLPSGFFLPWTHERRTFNPLGRTALFTVETPCHSGNMNVDAFEKQVNIWPTGEKVCIWISGLWLNSETPKGRECRSSMGSLRRPKCNPYTIPHRLTTPPELMTWLLSAVTRWVLESR